MAFFVWNFDGIDMDLIWFFSYGIYGIDMDFKCFFLYGIYGIDMDFMFFWYGILMELIWILHVFLMEF